MKRFHRVLFVVFAILFISPARAEIVLIKDGQPRATIVIAKEIAAVPFAEPEWAQRIWEQPREHKVGGAARDLQLYLEKLTGAKVPIVADDQPMDSKGVLILVGKSALTKEWDNEIPHGITLNREEEGYLIKAEGNRLLLAGNDDALYRGTEYAVYDFLREQGVRWYMPGEFGEFIPRKVGTISVKEGTRHGKPGFKMRNWWGQESERSMIMNYRFKVRNGLNPMTHFIMLPADSSIRAALPPPTEIDNPEFAEVWGLLANGKRNDGMPNLTSDKSVTYAAQKVKEYFEKYPKTDSYGIGGDDGLPRDYSPATVKRNLGFPDQVGRLGIPGEMSATEEWMEWIDKVAAEVHKDRPDRAITTNGYANRNTPPQGVKFDPNIWIMFAAIWSDTVHAYDNPRSWQTLRQGEMIRQWAQMSRNVYMYNYMYYMLASAGAPIPLTRKHAHDMPLYKKWGVVGFCSEGRYVAAEQGIFSNYINFRMMWDPSLNVEKEAKEFYANWYGPAAKPARAFWEALEVTMEETPMLGHEDRILPYVYSPELIKTLEKHVSEAEKLATDDWSKPRVHADRLILEHLKAYLAMHRAEFDADYVEAAKQAQRLVDLKKELAAISVGYFDPDPKTEETAGHYYWGAVLRRDFYRKMADLTTGKTGDMVKVLPEKAKFRADPRDDGRFFNWYGTDFDDSKWETLLTTTPFYAQGAPSAYRDSQGYPFMGAMWYRLDVDVPSAAEGKKVMLFCPAVETEAWVWVNGQFIGHREYHEAYERPNPIDMDVSKALKPGKTNSVVVRVHTGMNAAKQAAGLTSRLMLYSPKP